MLHNTKGDDNDKSSDAFCILMVTWGVTINAKEGDCSKQQLEQLLCHHWCQTY